jgi:hypothetical protein
MGLFLLFWSGDWKKQLQQMNEAFKRDFKKKSKHKHSVPQIKPVSAFLGIIIISGAVGKGGQALFEKEADRLKDGLFRLSPVIALSPHMSMRWFEGIKSYFPEAFDDFKANPREANHDPWYMFSKFIGAFNDNRSKLHCSISNKTIR